GKFKGLLDFLRRTRLRKDILYRLAMGGAFNNLAEGHPPREILWKFLELDLVVQEKDATQMSIFSMLEDDGGGPTAGGASGARLSATVKPAPFFKPLSPLERLQEDFN